MSAKVSTLFSGLPVTIQGDDVEVRGLTCDSRRVVPGGCFAALPGAKADATTSPPHPGARSWS